jgi:hypothetical protein
MEDEGGVAALAELEALLGGRLRLFERGGAGATATPTKL